MNTAQMEVFDNIRSFVDHIQLSYSDIIEENLRITNINDDLMKEVTYLRVENKSLQDDMLKKQSLNEKTIKCLYDNIFMLEDDRKQLTKVSSIINLEKQNEQLRLELETLYDKMHKLSIKPEPVAVPVLEPVAVPVAVVEPIVEPIVEPVAVPVLEPVVVPVTEPVAVPVKENAAENVVEPVTEPVVVPVTEPIVEPVTENVAENVVEPVAVPVEENAAENVVEPVEEPTQMAVKTIKGIQYYVDDEKFIYHKNEVLGESIGKLTKTADNKTKVIWF